MITNYRSKKRKKRIVLRIAMILAVILVAIGIFTIRLDFAAGSHRIIPTAVDTDIWGNYKVYFRTTDFMKNQDEDFYYIEKGNDELAEQMKGCIKSGKTIMVYYDRYLGFKGFTAPCSAPIYKIEEIE